LPLLLLLRLRLPAAVAAVVAVAVVFAHSPAQSSDYWLNVSLGEYQNKNYQSSIDAAHRALQFNPTSELAYNNLGAAYAALAQ
jgi:Flp pilus assembly protein TadD